MLSIKLVDALTTLHNNELGILRAEPAALQQAWQTVATALAESHATRAAMSTAAQERAEQRGSAPAGRPPSVEYSVAMGAQWQRRVTGIQAAHDLVVQTLATHKGNGRPPSRGSLAVHLSRNGSWWRHMATDDGEHDLTVTKVA